MIWPTDCGRSTGRNWISPWSDGGVQPIGNRRRDGQDSCWMMDDDHKLIQEVLADSVVSRLVASSGICPDVTDRGSALPI